MKMILVIVCVCIFYFSQYNGADLQNYRSEYISVEIKGCVQEVGVYELAYGSTVEDLIELAGGVNEEADTSTLNLSQTLSNQGVYVIAEISEQVKISINTASLEELCEITGVGEATAQKIIDYREQNGSFTSLEDIMNVSGIKEATYAKMQDQICL